MTETWWVPEARRATWRALPTCTLRFSEALALEFPEPRLPEMEQLVHALRPPSNVAEARAAAIRRAARRFLDAESAAHKEALDLLTAVTGRARGMIAASMDHLFGQWARPEVSARALREFAPGLEGFCAGRSAVSPRLTYHALAGNVPWAGVDSLLAATLVGSASLVKLSSREPVLAGLVARVLAEEDETIGGAIAVLHWPGGDHAIEEAVLQVADAVVAFGDNAAVASYATRLAHRIAAGRTRFLAHGHRLSAAVLGPAAQADARVAEALALDLACEDQEGCLSPHAVYLVAPTEPERFAKLLAAALDSYEARWPRRALDAATAATVQQERAAAEFAGARVLASEGSTAWTVIVDRTSPFAPAPTTRFARLRVVDSLGDAIAALEPARGILSTLGIAGFDNEPEAAGRLAALAPGRICRVGRMQRPPAGWNHEGASDAAALLQWTEWEAE